MSILSDDQVLTLLAAVPGWQRNGNTIMRTYKLESFPAALVFVSAVGHMAEAANHHPDILIQWRSVTLTLSTHDAGGITEKDFELARQIDGLPRKQ